VSDAVLVALVTSIPPTAVALVSLIVGIRATRKIEKVHKSTNSMKDALVALTDKEAHARGLAEGRREFGQDLGPL